MNFIRRLIDPRIKELELRLEYAEREATWYKDRCGEMVELVAKRNTALSAEYKRNRLREDALTNQLLELGGGRRLPTREEKPVEPDDDTPKRLATAADERLRGLAREYAVQKHQFGTPTEEEIDNTYSMMLENPDHWLGE